MQYPQYIRGVAVLTGVPLAAAKHPARFLFHPLISLIKFPLHFD